MDNLLSIVTFIPALAALILLVFLRGEDEAAQRNAKWVALLATGLTFLVSLFIMAGFDPRTRASRWSRSAHGSSVCNTRWGSTGSAFFS